MRRAALFAGLLSLAACEGRSPAPTPTPAATPLAAPTPAPGAARAIGTTSGLSAQTSALTGTVSDFAVERTATETRVQLAADTLFDFDKATLTPAAEANLQRTLDLARAGGAGTIRVIGYTDAKGSDAYNADLSRRRAEAVAGWLSDHMSGRRFDIVGRGAAEPVAPNSRPDGSDDPQGRARNRRVVVVIPR